MPQVSSVIIQRTEWESCTMPSLELIFFHDYYLCEFFYLYVSAVDCGFTVLSVMIFNLLYACSSIISKYEIWIIFIR